MAGVFISYRRDDSAGFAGRLADDLIERFGAERIFMDVTGIEPGADFRQAIAQKVADCGAVLVVIGQSWPGGARADGGGTRLQDPADFVRLEVASALERGIPVIPVLVDDAAMPAARDLPPDIEPLAWRNAVELRHAHWDADLKVLVTALDKLLPRTPEPAAVSPAVVPAPPRVDSSRSSRRFLWMIVAAMAAIGLSALALLRPWTGSLPPRDPGTAGGGRSGSPPAATIHVEGDVTVGTARYQVLSAQLEGANGGPRRLRVLVRMTNLRSNPDNFWDQSFRLVVDEAPAAPQAGLNELVDGYSAKDGEVVFEIDPSTTRAALQIINGKESTRIPIDLTSTTAGEVTPRRERSLNGPFPMTLPAVGDVRENAVVYRVLSATIARRNTDQLTLTLTIRVTNQTTPTINFWGQSFRLEVDGVPRAPNDAPNELVDGNSARQGQVEFVFDDTVETLALLVGDRREKARVPFTLRR